MMSEDAMEIMLHFCSSQVAISKGRNGSLFFIQVELGSTCAVLAGAHQGGKGICLVCGNVSPFIIFKSNFSFTEPAQILEQYKV
jgi:hypothetical protein